MDITFYRITDAPNKLEKTLENGYILTGTLRADTEIINPTIRVGFDCSAYNYVYIPVFNRYYFINSIKVVNNHMWEISCVVDVLMTYKDAIKTLVAELNNTANPNPYNANADYPTEVRIDTKQIDFPYSFERDNYMIMVAVGSGLV